MKKILVVGMDVHKHSYTLCALLKDYYGNHRIFDSVTTSSSVNCILNYLKTVREQIDEEVEIIMGYEAGGLGFSLYHRLRKELADNVNLVILAPTTMELPSSRIKTDKRDALAIARCLAFGGYEAVHIPDEHDEEVRLFLRMIEDHKTQRKMTKQRILAYCSLLGKHYEGNTKWTKVHLAYLEKLELNSLQRETLDEYLRTLHYLNERIEGFTARVNEICQEKCYTEKVRKLRCFAGIDSLSAITIVAEISDFNRFPKAGNFSSCLGLVPGEDSSGGSVRRTGITCAGNSHVRKTLIECTQAAVRANPYKKSKALKARQEGMPAEITDYADRAQKRIWKKFHKLYSKDPGKRPSTGKKRNTAIAACARELSCFIWGMMTGHTAVRI